MLRLIPALVLILILIVFGLSNRESVTLGFWPTDYSVVLPLSVAVLAAMAIAFVLGAAIVWIDHLGLGRRARRAEAEVRRLQAQLTQAEAMRQPPILRANPPIARTVPAGAVTVAGAPAAGTPVADTPAALPAKG